MESGPFISSSTTGIVSCVEFGPQYHFSTLLAHGTSESRLCVKLCTINENELHSVSNLAQALKFDTILNLPINTTMRRINSLSWSPESAYADSGMYIRLALTGSNDSVYMLTCNGEDSNITEMNIGHTQAVNNIAFHPLDERTLASVGDDYTCRIWDVEIGAVTSLFRLQSQGMAVSFNPSEPQQVMVTEKRGRIRFYNLSTKQPIRSLDCPQAPLLQADWSAVNSSRVGAVAANNWFCWDIRQSSLPCGVGVAHSTHSIGFKWCNTSDSVFSTISSSSQFKIHHYGHQKVPVSHDFPVANDMSWHPKLPIIALATNKRIHFWGVEA